MYQIWDVRNLQVRPFESVCELLDKCGQRKSARANPNGARCSVSCLIVVILRRSIIEICTDEEKEKFTAGLDAQGRRCSCISR